jgi:hypothetical protein
MDEDAGTNVPMTAHNIELCRACRAPCRFAFSQPVLGRETRYYECPKCGYLQTEEPYWLAEAYADPINDVDTGIMWRNQSNVGRVVMTLCAFRCLHGSIVDYAGGYGILVRLLRDAGLDAKWRDKYCQNLVARGFEAESGNFDLLTAFEVLEHLVDPVAELSQMLATSSIVLVTTELIPTPATPSPNWEYLGPEHGQHIGFFRRATLEAIAAKLKCHFSSDNVSVHVFSRRRIPLMWLPLQRLKFMWRLIRRFQLQSKMTLDFERLRQERKNP